MKNDFFGSASTGCLAESTTKWYNLETREFCPKLLRSEENRSMPPVDRARRRRLKKSILKHKMVLEPILCNSELRIKNGENRWNIVNECWDEGINITVGITINPLLDKFKTSKENREIIIDLQEGTVWSPLDRLKSLSEDSNEYAENILHFAFEPVQFTSKGIFGIRNSMVAFGRNPNDFDTLPYVCGLEEYNTGKKIFEETSKLLNMGVKDGDKANNWTEAFIKAWRRIRTNDHTLLRENEDGERLNFTKETEVLNNYINDLGLDYIGAHWRNFADKAYSSGKVGRWAGVLEDVIISCYNYKYKIKV